MKGGIICIAALALAVALLVPLSAWSQDCRESARLFDRAKANVGVALGEELLEQAVAKCPNFTAQAYYNYALAAGEEGHLDVARRYYQKTLKLKSDFFAAYAGLGDVAFTQGRFKQAEKYYKTFLDSLAGERTKGDPLGLLQHADKYRKKLERVRFKAQVHAASMRGVVSKELIVRGLSCPSCPRGVGGFRDRERLALSSILFDYDSATLKPESMRQVDELAKALKDPSLKHAKVLIEGHTDSFGSHVYNQALSLHRAESVRRALIDKGVAAKRLQAAGRGEARLLVATGSKEAQAPNRRVELVNKTN